jgi:ergothioneine biosynthesis protein EgtB
MPVVQQIKQRQPLLDRLVEARENTDRLFGLVKPAALYDRPIPARHRIVFYIGHLEAFDWNLLHQRLLQRPSFDAQFDRLFAFGIDPLDGGLPTDRPEDWPRIEEVRSYVSRVRKELDAGLETVLEDEEWLAGAEFPAGQLLQVAIEHRLMHAETLAYMLHQLPLARKIRPTPDPMLASSLAAPAMVEIPAGAATLGLRRAAGAFGWDNEFEENTVQVPAFRIDRFKITNAQYLEFMAAGGYHNPELWCAADWQWRTAHNLTHPGFWIDRGGSWFLRGMFEEFPVPADWPVYVSHAEASAYARWAGKALPSEAQWHRAAFGTPAGTERPYPWGGDAPDDSRGNFDFRRWDPAPVSAFPAGESAFGVMDLAGNGWEWTSTLFGPFPGFQPFAFYPGYSADFFDNQHYVMKGGSARTAACMLRRSFRNWFQPHYPYVYAGFRCVSH